jgi:hypothetical protein
MAALWVNGHTSLRSRSSTAGFSLVRTKDYLRGTAKLRTEGLYDIDLANIIQLVVTSRSRADA